MRYAIIIEKGKRNYSAYAPDVPGCIATGDSLEEIKRVMQESLVFHLEGMTEDGERTPRSNSICCYVDVAVPKRSGRKVRTAS